MALSRQVECLHIVVRGAVLLTWADGPFPPGRVSAHCRSWCGAADLGGWPFPARSGCNRRPDSTQHRPLPPSPRPEPATCAPLRIQNSPWARLHRHHRFPGCLRSWQPNHAPSLHLVSEHSLGVVVAIGPRGGVALRLCMSRAVLRVLPSCTSPVSSGQFPRRLQSPLASGSRFVDPVVTQRRRGVLSFSLRGQGSMAPRRDALRAHASRNPSDSDSDSADAGVPVPSADLSPSPVNLGTTPGEQPGTGTAGRQARCETEVRSWKQERSSDLWWDLTDLCTLRVTA